MNREKKQNKPEFNINDRKFNIKMWHLKDIEESTGDMLVEIKYNTELIREFIFPAYSCWNILTQFHNAIDSIFKIK